MMSVIGPKRASAFWTWVPLDLLPPSNNTAKKGDAVMRFVLCILSVALLPTFAFAAKGTMSLTEAHAAAAKGDADAAGPIMMTTDRQICLNECARRGHNKEQCTNACRPGLCHPGAEQPYCIAK